MDFSFFWLTACLLCIVIGLMFILVATMGKLHEIEEKLTKLDGIVHMGLNLIDNQMRDVEFNTAQILERKDEDIERIITCLNIIERFGEEEDEDNEEQ